MGKLIVDMVFTKATKNTNVYAAADTAIPQLYIQKSEMPQVPPNEIKVTVEYAV